MVKTTVRVEGMMCGMCESHVNDAIRNKYPKARKVKSSRRKGLTTFVTEEVPNEADVISAITDTGYTVISVESK